MPKPSLPTAPGFRFCTNTSAFAGHSFEQCFVFGPGEIEHNRLLTAIKPDEIGTLAMDDVIVVAREIAFGALDLDYARAGIGETACALRRRHRLLDRDNQNSGERKSHNVRGNEAFPLTRK